MLRRCFLTVVLLLVLGASASAQILDAERLTTTEFAALDRARTTVARHAGVTSSS